MRYRVGGCGELLLVWCGLLTGLALLLLHVAVEYGSMLIVAARRKREATRDMMLMKQCPSLPSTVPFQPGADEAATNSAASNSTFQFNFSHSDSFNASQK